jgi:Neprosin
MSVDEHHGDDEFGLWLKARHTGLKIVKTTETARGQILDWVPVESQTSDGTIATPPNIPTLGDLDASRFEFGDPGFETGPAGTVPIVRPKSIRVKEKTKRGGLHIARRLRARLHPERAPADPDPFGYFHASEGQYASVFGCDGFINVWRPAINLPPNGGEDHSIMQIWLLNYAQPQAQSVEFGWTVDQDLNHNTSPCIFTYYTTNDYTKDDDNIGGYNQVYKGWVQRSTKLFPGSILTQVSAAGGQQIEIAFQIALHENNWWISVDGEMMGYYPAALFPAGGMGNGASWASFGGEVFSGLPNPTLTQNQMGSGRLPSAGANQAAYMRNLRIQTDAAGTMANSNGQSEQDSGNAGPLVYGIDMHMNSGTAWESFIYIGGPAA